jgi:hypothetical protein
MIKALSLAAVLALLPVPDAVAEPQEEPSGQAIEAAAEAFGARMEAFEARAEAISEDASLSEAQREARIAALWAEYQPEVTAFTAAVTEFALAAAGQALAEIDIGGIVADALSAASGVVANGAWASNDPEHLVTYGLMANYAVGEAMDSLEAAHGEVEASAAALAGTGKDVPDED